MKQSIAHVALVVQDYDEAIAFFVGMLQFTLVEDTYVPGQDKRWVLVAPPGSTGTSILLARPSHAGQEAFIGNQTGGRVTFFLRTDDFWRDYQRMLAAGIEFVREPMTAPYGIVAVFKDLYGNLWDLVEPRAHARAAELITQLNLSPHPEGGFFREIHRSTAIVDPRDGRTQRTALTTIYFLLTAGEISRWHRVGSDEAWHFIEGDVLELHVADAGFEGVVTAMLGPLNEQAIQAHVVDAGCWQAARSTGDYTLVSCTVAPGFEYADFVMLHDLPAETESFRRRQPQLAAFV